MLKSMPMRIVTLNIRHGGGSRWEHIVDQLLLLQPEIVVLTEFRAGNVGELILNRLKSAGLSETNSAARVPRENSVCIISNQKFRAIDLLLPLGDEHRFLACEFNRLRLIATYFPQREQKRKAFDYVRTKCLPALGARGIVIGDLNTGVHRQDEAEASFHCAAEFVQLLDAGLIDSWRSRNSQGREFSWFSSAGNGFRIDHALCTPEIDAEIESVAYAHQFRELGFTDHSALVVDLKS